MTSKEITESHNKLQTSAQKEQNLLFCLENKRKELYIKKLEKDLEDAHQQIEILKKKLKEFNSNCTPIQLEINYGSDKEDLDEWHQLYEMNMDSMYIETRKDVVLSDYQHCLQHHEFYGSG
jgi:hypothetical protein